MKLLSEAAHVRDKIEISQLPVSEEFLPERRLLQERGELPLIVDGAPMRPLACFFLPPGAYFRGGRCHRAKTENFYLIKGRARLLTHDLTTGLKGEHPLVSGDKVRISPLLAHRFVADKEAWGIEYYDAVYDPADDVAFTDF